MSVAVQKDHYPRDPFYRKTYGRIFVSGEEDVEIVKKIIADVDPNEVSYMPKELVAVYKAGEPNQLVYLHKFEICKLALMRACLAVDLWIWCVDGMQEGETV